MKEIGDRLRTLRTTAKLTQVQLGKMLGVQQSRINRYESGQSTPSPELFTQIADIFDVSMDYLYCRTDNPHGKYYTAKPDIPLQPKITTQEDIRNFIEMCFDPSTPESKHFKEIMFNLMTGSDNE